MCHQVTRSVLQYCRCRSREKLSAAVTWSNEAKNCHSSHALLPIEGLYWSPGCDIVVYPISQSELAMPELRSQHIRGSSWSHGTVLGCASCHRCRTGRSISLRQFPFTKCQTTSSEPAVCCLQNRHMCWRLASLVECRSRFVAAPGP